MMGRLPAVLELAGGKSTRQRIWEAVRARAAEPFVAAEIARECELELEPVREYLKCLRAGGYLAVSDAPRALRHAGVKNVFFLTRDNGVEAPRLRRDGSPVTQGRGTEAMWAAMTALDTFDFHLIAELAQVKPATAASYLHAIAQAGYLDVVTRGKGKGKGGVATVWAVAAWARHLTRAPMITRLKTVYDPNCHRIVWHEGADAAADQVELGEVL